MDRSNPQVTLESAIGGGSLAVDKETVSQMAARYEQALNSWGGTWGPRTHPIVAINGSFYDVPTGVPEGAMVASGWFTNWHYKHVTAIGFVWTLERQALMSQCIAYEPDRQQLTFLASGDTFPISGVDVEPGRNEVIVYTPAYATTTPESEAVAEVLVELSRPMTVMPNPAMVKGVIRDVRDSQGGTPIPFDHVVLSGVRHFRSVLLNQARVGEEIGISLEITDLGEGCKSRVTPDWTKAYAGLGGSYDFLRDGQVREFSDPGATLRHPRTALCYNDEYIHFVVVDGRQAGWSIGMTMDDMAGFCQGELGATWGMNLDGGGSSTMWVNGEIMNRPSDGHERAVANGLMMVVVEPKEQSSRFSPGQHVIAQREAELRLGPGRSYSVIGAVTPGAELELLPELSQLEGILATGSFWWKVCAGGQQGWIMQEALTSDSGDLALKVQPSPQGGDTAPPATVP